MREHLLPEEQKVVTREAYLQLEADILQRMSFNFNWPGPLPSLERYVRILRVDPIMLKEMSCQICMFAQNDAKLLGFAPSQLAACSLIICLNIYHFEQEQKY